jgi:hypothetical protein
LVISAVAFGHAHEHGKVPSPHRKNRFMTRLHLGKTPVTAASNSVQGDLVDYDGDRFYRIQHAELMRPFFMSVVSDSDHWLFAASNGGLTAGRKNPKLALFPYLTEDKIVDSAGISGPYTALIATRESSQLWHPFRDSELLVYASSRVLYKSVLGNRLIFEERNEDLGLCFRYEWKTSQRFGFVRECTLTNTGKSGVKVRLLDGLLNIMPADVEEGLALGFSCLLDAYKRSEVLGNSLAVYALAAQVVDRAEPRESLHASSVFSLGLERARVHLSAEGLARFDRGLVLDAEADVRGRRGAYLLEAELELAAGAEQRWLQVADVQQSQAQVSAVLERLSRPAELRAELEADLRAGTENLRRILASTDGLQTTGDELASAHHVANVLFNDMRGGVFAQGYTIPGADFASFVRGSNLGVWQKHESWLATLPPAIERSALLEAAVARSDADLERLAYEYLPLTFSRRHGDPSRPWNRFDIQVRDGAGNQLLNYQGNWRDIFQNWEALCTSYPEFVEHVIVKFLNASTADGYNPYRITKQGIDWEVPEPDHPWSFIGYWGDHQIIYLLKLLELSEAHHPARLRELLQREIFAYANVPYEIKPYADIVRDPKNTIDFDHAKHKRIMALHAELGADAKLLLGSGGVYRANLVEKLLVTALAKLTNFVPGGGIWLNTQRPEWNDANNALVGFGVSMVTLYYLDRFLAFLPGLLGSLRGQRVELSSEVKQLFESVRAAFQAHQGLLEQKQTDDTARKALMDDLGAAGGAYRARLYASGLSGRERLSGDELLDFVALSAKFLRHTIAQNRREDGLYHAYNLLAPRADGRGFGVEHLYEMLEGQVAALSSDALDTAETERVLAALAKSPMYRSDQKSYTLYPDRALPGFLQKNGVPEALLEADPLLTRMIQAKDTRIVYRDAQRRLRFNPDFYNADVLKSALAAVQKSGSYPELDQAACARIEGLYETVFNHRAFTGRSGTMFGYEGLGSIYWHMVGKLMLSAQERYFAAAQRGESPALLHGLSAHYYTIRAGIGGFNKTPLEYGAFPLDPYSHTPAHSGARQPGMTGQVKEEVITRLGELGVRVADGVIAFRPLLLRKVEFLGAPSALDTFDAAGKPRRIALEAGTLGFTYCQLPVVYHSSSERHIRLTAADGSTREISGDALDRELSAAIFRRQSGLSRIDVWTAAGL